MFALNSDVVANVFHKNILIMADISMCFVLLIERQIVVVTDNTYNEQCMLV